MKLPFKRALKKTVLKNLFQLSDYIDKLGRVDGQIIPPKSLWVLYGDANLYESGLEFFKYFLDYCELKRDGKVLDIGCNIGRMAFPLTAYLTSEGSYDGFDIMPVCIEYCQKNITPVYPNFNFQVADIYSPYYNPEGTQTPEAYQFPFPDNHFDLVFSASVFTHLPPPAIKNYLKETARVLKPGGYSLHTFFLVNEKSLASIKAGKSKINFKYQQKDGCMTTHPEIVEYCIGVPEKDILTMHQEHNLQLTGDIFYGRWCDRPQFLGYQDMIVAKKY